MTSFNKHYSLTIKKTSIVTENNSNNVQNAQAFNNFVEKYVKNSKSGENFTEVEYIDAEVYEQLEKEADVLGITVGVLVNAIFKEFIDRYQTSGK